MIPDVVPVTDIIGIPSVTSWAIPRPRKGMNAILTFPPTPRTPQFKGQMMNISYIYYIDICTFCIWILPVPSLPAHVSHMSPGSDPPTIT